MEVRWCRGSVSEGNKDAEVLRAQEGHDEVRQSTARTMVATAGLFASGNGCALRTELREAPVKTVTHGAV